MALVSSIVVDNTLQTATLLITLCGDPVESIVFDNVSKTLTFYERGEILISGKDFIELIEQIKIFEVAMLLNFSTNNVQKLPYHQTITYNNLDSTEWLITLSRLKNYQAQVIDYFNS